MIDELPEVLLWTLTSIQIIYHCDAFTFFSQCYQLPCGSRGLAHRAAERDVTEGADMLMVKPGLAYLDVVRDIKNAFPHHPMFIYQVSGEFAMLHHAAAAGAINLEATLMEVLTSMRRAGVDVIISYFTPKILEMIKKN